MRILHTMIRVSSLEKTIAFFEVLGLREIRRRPDEKGRYTNVFLAAPGDEEFSPHRWHAFVNGDGCPVRAQDFGGHQARRPAADDGNASKINTRRISVHSHTNYRNGQQKQCSLLVSIVCM